MKLGHSFLSASGSSKDDCHVLAYRFQEGVGFRPQAGESWVLQLRRDTLAGLRGIAGWFVGLWQSPTGKVYVAEVSQRIHINRDPRPGSEWEVVQVPCVLRGIWGLHDDLIFAWGGLGDREQMVRWNGRTWDSIEPPPGFTLGMHGIAPDIIYAVGQNGLIARWDGSRWNKVPSPTQTTLSSVFVVSEDEMYACGNGRRLLQGSIHGWSELLEGEGQLLSVVKWKGDVWVAAPDVGLLKLEGNKLTNVKPNLKASRLDARGNLLVTCPQRISQSADGQSFFGSGIDPFVDSLKNIRPMWLSRGEEPGIEDEEADDDTP